MTDQATVQSIGHALNLTLADAAVLDLAAREIDRWTDVLAGYGISLFEVGCSTVDARQLAARIREAEDAEGTRRDGAL